MSLFLAQLALAARDHDSNNWMNILFLVVVAILYAVGGLIKKVKDQKITFGEKRQPSPQQPSQKPPARPKPQQIQPKPAPQRSTARQYQVPAERPLPAQYIPAFQPTIPIQPQPLDVEPQLTANFTKSIKNLKDDVRLEPISVPNTFDTEDTAFVFEGAAQFATSDDLRRAVIYYEVFGSPIALRPSQGPPGCNP